MTKAREIAELGQKLTVDASGNLDIAGTGFFDGMALGTATGLESTKLNVQRQQGTVAQMTTTDHGENVYLQFSAEDDGGTARTGQVFFDPDLNSIGFRNGGVNVLHVENTGNLGLGGAPVPSASGYDKATAHLRQPDGGKGAQLRFTTAASGHTSADGGFISYWSDNNFYYNNLQSADHIFYTGGNARLKIANNNVLTAYGGAIFNENGDNADFRVESDALTHALFLDASSNQLAVGTSSPKTKAVFSGSSGTGSNLGDADTLINQASQGFITIENTDDTLGVEAGAIFRAKQSGAGAWAIYTKQTQDYIGDLMFRTRNGGSSSTEFMRLRNGSRTVEVKDTRGSSAQGPFLELNRESPSPADNDYGGAITFTANNDAAESISIADIWTRFHDVSDGTEDSRMTFRTRQDGTLHDRMTFREGESSFNDQSADIDFRVESDTNSNMLLVDAGSNRVGVATTPSYGSLHVNGPIAVTGDNGPSGSGIMMGDYGTTGGYKWIQSFSSQPMYLNPLGNTVQIGSSAQSGSGNLTTYGTSTFNEGGLDKDFRVESDSNGNMLFIDASANNVNVGTNNSGYSGTFNVASGTNTTVASFESALGGAGAAATLRLGVSTRSSNGLQLSSMGSGASILGGSLSAAVMNTENSSLVFGTNNTIRARFKQTGSINGMFCVGTDADDLYGSSSQTGVTLQGSSQRNNGNGAAIQVSSKEDEGWACVYLNRWYTSTQDARFVQLSYNGTTVGSIQRSGTNATVYNTTSDYRLKENVVDLTGGIDRVKQLQPRRFNFIADETNTLIDGFIAHEVDTVVPEAVTGEKDAMKVDESGNSVINAQEMDASKLVPLLTAALQEAITKIETLETQRADMETRLAALESA